MGKWNRRYLPRKKYRNYDYEDPPASPHNSQSYPSGIESSGIPPWEIDFCNSAKVPWRKIVASKKYIYCYPSVLNWDDSAGKEAFDDAKQRYWAMVNGVPYDNPLPNPYMYIDDVDWDPYLDPELMEDLDNQFFNPDDEHNDSKLETINEEVGCSQAEDDKNQSGNDDPWERNHVQGAGSIKDLAQGWSKWDDSVKLKNDNPWEQSTNQHVDSLKGNAWRSGNVNDNPWEQSANQHADSSEDNAWRNGNASWGGNQWHGSAWSSAVVDNKCANPCRNGSQTVDVRQEGWGRAKSNSWGRSNWNPNDQTVRNSANNGRSWESKCSNSPKDRGWTDNRNGSWGWRDSNYQLHEPNYWDSGRSFQGGCRKREGSVQHTSKYKSSRYQV